jgi:hypothetical protein
LANEINTFVHVKEIRFSSDVISHWEVQQASSVSNHKHNKEVLAKLVQKCGLKSSNLSTHKLRVLLASLRAERVPIRAAEVKLLLTETHNEVIGGTLKHFVT